MRNFILLCFLLAAAFSVTLFTGCGEVDEEDSGAAESGVNSQPVIESITDQTLDVEDTVTVTVHITDADADDTHTVKAASADAGVATVAVSGKVLTLEGRAAGTTSITVSATDSSGQDNATASPVTFAVIVNEIEIPNAYTPLEGLIVSKGRVQFLFFSAGRCIILGGARINGVVYITHNSKWQRREDETSPWVDIPGTESDEGLCAYSPDLPGEYRLVGELSIDGTREKYASENFLKI